MRMMMMIRNSWACFDGLIQTSLNSQPGFLLLDNVREAGLSFLI